MRDHAAVVITIVSNNNVELTSNNYIINLHYKTLVCNILNSKRKITLNQTSINVFFFSW